MNKTIHIHIGWHKTGTSAIQGFLLSNRDKLVSQEGIYYPSEGMLICAHHTIAWVLQNQKTSPWGDVEIPKEGVEKFFEDISESAKSKSCDTVVLSSEVFCTLKKEEISVLRSALEKNGFDTKIIAYVRRQDLLIESVYNMQVKWWGTRLKQDFSGHMKNRHPSNLVYTPVIDLWADAFGIDSITVRPFCHEKLEGGDVTKDFCNTLNIDWSRLKIETKRINESLASSQALEFLRIMNNLDLTKEFNIELTAKLFEYEQKENLPKCVLFSPEERVAFMDALNESNRTLSKFTKDIDFLLLPAHENLPEKNHKPLTLDEFIDIFQFVTKP